MDTNLTLFSSQQLRSRIAAINENIDDMVSTILRLADRVGWADKRVAELDQEIRWWEDRRKALRGELNCRGRDVA